MTREELNKLEKEKSFKTLVEESMEILDLKKKIDDYKKVVERSMSLEITKEYSQLKDWLTELLIIKENKLKVIQPVYEYKTMLNQSHDDLNELSKEGWNLISIYGSGLDCIHYTFHKEVE